jgi:hypothetical protein
MNSDQPRKVRLSLTKAQIQAGVGAELLALCQSVTEDGSLSKEDIVALRSWLKANRSSDLPAVAFLAWTVERTVADGKVTREKRDDLYQAIETVLPPEARKEAVAHRKVVEAERQAQERAQKRALEAKQKSEELVEHEAHRREEQEKRERNRALYSSNFMVAGVYYEGRPEVIRQFAEDNDQVFLVRDRRNRYSRNAIEIRLGNGMQVGFVPEDDAREMSHFLDEGCPHQAYITKILTGGRVPIPVVQANVYRSDSDVEGVVFEADAPEKRLHKSPSGLGCLTSVILVLLPVFVAFVMLFSH